LNVNETIHRESNTFLILYWKIQQVFEYLCVILGSLFALWILNFHLVRLISLWVDRLIWIINCTFRGVKFSYLPVGQRTLFTFLERLLSNDIIAANRPINFLRVLLNWCQRKVEWRRVRSNWRNLAQIRKFVGRIAGLSFPVILERKDVLIGRTVLLTRLRVFYKLLKLDVLEATHGLDPVIRFLALFLWYLITASPRPLRAVEGPILRTLGSHTTTSPFMFNWGFVWIFFNWRLWSRRLPFNIHFKFKFQNYL
jgi:hypothetical protein